MVSRRKTHRFSVRSHRQAADLFHAGGWKQTPGADERRRKQGAGMVRLYQVNLEVTGMNRSQSWKSAAMLLTVMAIVSVGCKKTPAPPPPPPSTGTTTGITPV